MGETTPGLRRERWRRLLWVFAASAAIGGVFGMFLGLTGLSAGVYGPRTVLIGALIGVVQSTLTAGSIVACEISLRDSPYLRRLRAAPFLVVVLLKTVVYAAIILAIQEADPGQRLIGLLVGVNLADREGAPSLPSVTITFGLVVTLAFVLTLQVAQLVGGRNLRNLVLGRYRRPREERRFILFVDVVGSTALAERLGALGAHRFLSGVFAAFAEPIAACRGEIYQYVGDEIVVTWEETDGVVDGRPLRCFFAMQAALEGRAELRGALHLGPVIAGEVGVQRRAIVYHGDVMNTASRLEQATRDLGHRFIVSAEAVSALGAVRGVAFQDLGVLALRGRQSEIRAWAAQLA